MSVEEFKSELRKYGQNKLLSHIEKLDEAGVQAIMKQLEGFDLENLKLAEEFRNRTEAPKRGVISPIQAMTLSDIEAQKDELYEIGASAIRAGKVGAVLLAGGQGTRLGFDKAKGMYNIGLTKDVFIFQRLIENLLDVVREVGASIPLYVMTSDINHEDTVSFFAEHDYFGYRKEDIVFYMQDMAPATDHDGQLLLESERKLVLSPNGNGGWYASMKRQGLCEDLKRRGVTYLNVFAVDNVLQRIADPVFVGATLKGGYACGSKVVGKAAPEERVGVLCLEDGHPSIVEYYELTEEMIHQREASGVLSYNYGVILNYLFEVSALEAIMNQKLMVHVVEKKVPYMAEDGTTVHPETPNGYKYEILVLDMISMLPSCLPFEVVREKEFAPIKNPTGVDSVESARELLRLNNISL